MIKTTEKVVGNIFYASSSLLLNDKNSIFFMSFRSKLIPKITKEEQTDTRTLDPVGSRVNPLICIDVHRNFTECVEIHQS